MSTKIFDAYYVPHGMNGVLEIKKFIERKYEEHIHKKLNAFANTTGKRMFLSPDFLLGFEKDWLETVNTYKKPEVPNWERPIREMDTLALEYLINASCRDMRRGVPLDFDQSMVVYWYQKKAYVQFFNFNFEFDKMFQELRKNRKIKDFHYQNCTDRPDRISEEKWDDRHNIWEGIFKEQGADAPAQCGFTVKFIDRLNHILFRWENLIHRGSVDAW